MIVHLYEELGDDFVTKLRGMFAIALWDSRKKLLLLARDRVGIKPLYYFLGDRFLSFGSEIKAILAGRQVGREIDPDLIARFLTFLYVPGSRTLLRGVHKLAPGSLLVLKDGKTTIRQYWDLHFDRPAEPTDLKTAERRLLELLDEAVQLHMISDVPVGFLLSGGVDSTAMLSLAAGKTDQPLSSYTIGFDEPGLDDERPYARLAARRFDTDHHEMSITSGEFVDFLPKYIWHMEEPVCEPPAIALYYVSKMARQNVKVLISGEGGDEAFAGYPEYRNLKWLEMLKHGLGPLSGTAGIALEVLGRITRSRRLAKYAPLMSIPLADYYYSRTSNPFTIFNRDVANFYEPTFLTQVQGARPADVIRECFASTNGSSAVEQMLYVDTKTWLPDDLLLKADKMTMANSLELRVPLLDHKLLEFAASLPLEYKVKGHRLKYIFKNALQDRVPREILSRRKAGFPVPYKAWIQMELHTMMCDVLSDSRTTSRGYFQRTAVQKILDANRTTGVYSKELFSLVVLELWHRAFIDCAQPVSTSGMGHGSQDWRVQ